MQVLVMRTMARCCMNCSTPTTSASLWPRTPPRWRYVVHSRCVCLWHECAVSCWSHSAPLCSCLHAEHCCRGCRVLWWLKVSYSTRHALYCSSNFGLVLSYHEKVLHDPIASLHSFGVRPWLLITLVGAIASVKANVLCFIHICIYNVYLCIFIYKCI